MKGKSAEGATIGAVVEGRIDMCNEDSMGSCQGEAKCAGVDKVLGESSDFAPGVGCDATLVDTSGKGLKRKYDLGTNG